MAAASQMDALSAAVPSPSSGWFLSFITLSKTIIGAGVLALPYTLAQTGLIIGLFLLGVAALVQAYTLHLVAVCVVSQHSKLVGAKSPTFYSLASDAGIPGWLIEGCIGFATFGFATSYLVVMGDLAPQIAAAVRRRHTF
eukprot:SAG31_NODE_815_length_11876_cov_2.189182_9_plen_140_part_00